MRSVEIRTKIKAPRDIVLNEISEYTHPPILHNWVIKSVTVFEDDGKVSTALWHIKVFGILSKATQRQVIRAPDMMTNETIRGFSKGTLETTLLYETDEGTEIVDRVDVRIPIFGIFLETPVAWYTKRITERILNDHKLDLESRFAEAFNQEAKTTAAGQAR